MKTMKRTFQIAGIIAFAALTCFSLAGCDQAWSGRDWSVLNGANPEDNGHTGDNNGNTGDNTGWTLPGRWHRIDSSRGITYNLRFEGSASSGYWYLDYKEYSDDYLTYTQRSYSGPYNYSSGNLQLSNDLSYSGRVTITSTTLSFSNYVPIDGLSGSFTRGEAPAPQPWSATYNRYDSDFYNDQLYLDINGTESEGYWSIYTKDSYGTYEKGSGTYARIFSHLVLHVSSTISNGYLSSGEDYSGSLSFYYSRLDLSGFWAGIFNGDWIRVVN